MCDLGKTHTKSQQSGNNSLGPGPASVCGLTQQKLTLPHCATWRIIQYPCTAPLDVLSWGCLHTLVAANTGTLQRLVLNRLMVENTAAGLDRMLGSLAGLRYLELDNVMCLTPHAPWTAVPRGIETIKVVRDLAGEATHRRDHPQLQHYRGVILPPNDVVRGLRELHIVLQETVSFNEFFDPPPQAVTARIPRLSVTFTRRDFWPVGPPMPPRCPVSTSRDTGSTTA